jgi:hypothetical protein
MTSFHLKSSIKIKGYRYKIILKKFLKDDDGNLCDGLHDHEKKVIYLRRDLKGEGMRKTFLHEFFHAYIFECNIREGLDSQLEEVIVETLSQATDDHFELKWR